MASHSHRHSGAAAVQSAPALVTDPCKTGDAAEDKLEKDKAAAEEKDEKAKNLSKTADAAEDKDEKALAKAEDKKEKADLKTCEATRKSSTKPAKAA